MNRIFWFLPFFVLCLLNSAELPAAGLSERLAAAIDKSSVSQRTHIALHVINVETGETHFAQNEKLLFTPASNMKLYSSSAALQILGPEHTFETVVGTISPPQKGVAHDLYLIAGGNPVLSGNDLRELARRVRHELGISRLTGDVLLDLSLFDSPLKGPGWAWDDDPDTYNMSVTPLMVDYNVLTVSVAPGAAGEWPDVTMSLPSPYPPVVNLATTAEDAETKITITRRPFEDLIVVSGEVGASARARQHQLTMHDPSRWAGEVFFQMLKEEGVSIRGELDVRPVEESLRAKIVHQSPQLSQILPLFNKPSENAIGEMLLHHLALAAGEKPANWRNGSRALSQWLTETVGLAEESLRVADGSGLSRYNMITAEGTTQLLRFMWNHPYAEEFRSFAANRGSGWNAFRPG